MRSLTYLYTHGTEVLILTLEHLEIVLVATLLAFVTAVPLGVWIARRRPWAGPVLALASGIMTVPSIALLGLLIPVLSVIGQGIGRVPTVIALVLYAQLPIVRNTYTALVTMDPDVLDAARGMGMTPSQRLWRVEVPIALPLILGGVRTAVVMSIGVTAIAAYIGAGGLGHLIQVGLNAADDAIVLAGALVLAALAVAAELLLGWAQRALTPPGMRS
ncbi:MAG: ABC transporter permease [SAR324 cluster bacterium]|nr:ABC transporter permease [SAR324 cluster bacterium]